MADKETAPTKPPAAKAVTDWFIIDTTATHEAPRTHEQIVDGRIKAYKFEAGTPLAMPAAIAIKFLRESAFVRTNEKGEAIEYKRAPKQPEELGAGEKLVLKDNETVSRYDELSTAALLQRAIELSGGEKFAQGANKPDREEMIAFIVAAKVALRKANTSKEADRHRDEFVPEADVDDDEMAA